MNMIVAFCKNRGIGIQNNLPWKLSNDLKHFKKTTSEGDNNCVIMGRNTWDSLKYKPLKNRINIILSSSLNKNEIKKYKETYVVSNFDSLNNEINNLLNDKKKIWLIGGKSIYDYYIENPKLDKIYVTYINDNFSCDVKFPKIPPNFFVMKNSKLFYQNKILYNFLVYDNKNRV